MGVVKNTGGVLLLTTPTVAVGVTGHKYLEDNRSNTPDIRVDLDKGTPTAKEMNKEDRKIHKSFIDIESSTDTSVRMIINEINTMIVAVRDKFKTKPLEATDIDKENVAKTVNENIFFRENHGV